MVVGVVVVQLLIAAAGDCVGTSSDDRGVSGANIVDGDGGHGYDGRCAYLALFISGVFQIRTVNQRIHAVI
jgi:hypothetical protein